MCIGSYLWYVFALHQHRTQVHIMFRTCATYHLGLNRFWRTSTARWPRPPRGGCTVGSSPPARRCTAGWSRQARRCTASWAQTAAGCPAGAVHPAPLRVDSTPPGRTWPGPPGTRPACPGKYVATDVANARAGHATTFLRQLVTSSRTCKKEKPSGPNVYSSKASSNNCLVVILYFFALSRQCPALRNSMVEDNLAACQHTQVGM